jgi:glutathionyl-hydroquinone reductase
VVVVPSTEVHPQVNQDLLYPVDLRGEIDQLQQWLAPVRDQAVARATGAGADAERTQARLWAAFDDLEETFAESRYLLGRQLTLADVQLFVTLVRYDQQVGTDGQAGPPLSAWPQLWAYARELYQQEAFRAVVRLETLAAKRSTLNWEAPVDRAGIGWSVRRLVG